MDFNISYSIIVDYFISDNKYSVMLGDFTSGEILEGTEVQNLDLIEMIKEVEEKRKRLFIVQLESYVYNEKQTQVYGEVVEFN